MVYKEVGWFDLSLFSSCSLHSLYSSFSDVGLVGVIVAAANTFKVSLLACSYNLTFCLTLRGTDKHKLRISEQWLEPSKGGSIVQGVNTDGSEI